MFAFSHLYFFIIDAMVFIHYDHLLGRKTGSQRQAVQVLTFTCQLFLHTASFAHSYYHIQCKQIYGLMSELSIKLF